MLAEDAKTATVGASRQRRRCGNGSGTKGFT